MLNWDLFMVLVPYIRWNMVTFKDHCDYLPENEYWWDWKMMRKFLLKRSPFLGEMIIYRVEKSLFVQIPAQVVTLPNHLIRTRHLMAGQPTPP